MKMAPAFLSWRTTSASVVAHWVLLVGAPSSTWYALHFDVILHRKWHAEQNRGCACQLNPTPYNRPLRLTGLSYCIGKLGVRHRVQARLESGEPADVSLDEFGRRDLFPSDQFQHLSERQTQWNPS